MADRRNPNNKKDYVKKGPKGIMKLVSWSFSRLKNYRTCPLKAKFAYIDKLKEPTNDAMARGSHIHKLAEQYVLGSIKRLPKELKLFDDEFKAVKKAIKNKEIMVFAESQAAFDNKWKVCDWFGAAVYCRMVLDLVYYKIKEPETVYIIDYKTGKIREENLEQLDLYALGIFLKFPLAQKVVAEFWYLDQDSQEAWVSVEYTRDKDLKRLQKYWDKEVKPYLNDRTFAPRPNALCGWCNFSKAKGGTCQY